jgi:hypothetical protein
MKKWVLYIVVVIVALSCRRNSNGSNQKMGTTTFDRQKDMPLIITSIAENKAKVQNGDLIERTDDDIESESVRNFSKTDKTFSHCGIAFIEDGNVFVYNVIAGKENPSEKMVREPYDSFVSPYRKSGFGIFRYALADSEIIKLHHITKQGYANNMQFDKTFDLKSDDKLYCAEMIYKYLIQATNNRVVLPTTTMQDFRTRDPKYKGLLLKQFEYIGLDNLFLNSFCREITRVSYK